MAYHSQKIVATIEARMTSSRLPGKVLLPLAGKPALERLIERLQRSQYVDEIVVATTVNAGDDSIAALAEKLGVRSHRGSEEDVLKRVLEAAQSAGADVIVEITGDCPLVDWRLVDRGVKELFDKKLDFSANNIVPTYPDGFDVRVFPLSVLKKIDALTNDPIDRVHVSYYMNTHSQDFRIHNWNAEPEDYLPEGRVTLDEKTDYDLLNTIFETLLPLNNDFSASDVIRLLKTRPELFAMNQHVKAKTPEQG